MWVTIYVRLWTVYLFSDTVFRARIWILKLQTFFKTKKFYWDGTGKGAIIGKSCQIFWEEGAVFHS